MTRKQILWLIVGITVTGYSMYFIQLAMKDDHVVATFWVFFINAWGFALGAKYASLPKKKKKGKK